MGRAEELLKTYSVDESNQQIARDVMKLYDRGMTKDWDMSDVDDVVDKYLPNNNGGTLDKQILAMDPKEAQKMWKEILPLKKELEDQLDHDEVENGDYVDFGPYGKLYVLDINDHSKYFWVTKSKKDRFNPKARGNTILKTSAEKIIEPASDVDPDDYNDDED